jgi:hypothetical protein
MHEMLSGGDLDYLTGDYLAELTMLILGRDRMKSPDRGDARSFLTQLEQCLGTAADRGVRIVVNAGGTLTLQGKQAAHSSGTLTVDKDGSFFNCTPVIAL